MSKSGLKKILVANRGEIAIRVMRTCKELGIRTVAIFSDPDARSLHAQYADEAYPLEGTKPGETYLHQAKILAIAKRANVDGVHPGYGFLSENPEFADAVAASGMTFIGPSGTSIRLLGDKTAARSLAKKLGVPTVPGTLEPLQSESEAKDTASRIGYPILLKAAAGGGGKGMRVVHSELELGSSLRAAHSEAMNAFGDDRVYMEKYVAAPRHVEMQILADGQGNAVYLGERECSIQRRHQKVLEESPSPIVDETMRAAMGAAALKLVQAGQYVNAGTVEFIVDADRKFYFLEVNTRLQVEHPVTELVTGLDLVAEQIRVAEGASLQFSQSDIRHNGHAIECRVYAEDPAEGFLPSTGTLLRYRLPDGPRIRVDNGFREGDEVTPFYDPMLAKVIAWGADRKQSLQVLDRALSEFVIDGVQTTIPFCRFVLSHEAFRSGVFTTGFVAEHFHPETLNQLDPDELEAVVAAVSSKFSSARAMASEAQSVGPSKTSLWKKNRTEA